MQSFQIRPFENTEKLDKFLHNKATKEEEIESGLIFLGCISKKWMTSECKKSDKWLNTVVTESVKFFAQSWEERNE